MQTRSKARSKAQSPWDSLWERNYSKLRMFHAAYGHCRVPFPGKLRSLAKWVNNQRQRSTLTPDQRSKLDALGYDWSVDVRIKRVDAVWDAVFDRLVAYKEKNGNCLVPQTYEKDQTLATWVANQRRVNNQGKLKPHRIAKLDEIDFAWAVRPATGGKKSARKPVRKPGNKNDQNWMEMYRRLEAFHQTHKHVRVPHLYRDDPQLGLWVSTQRRCFHQKTWCGSKMAIRKDRKDLLDKLGFVWDAAKKSAKSSQRDAALVDKTPRNVGKDKDGEESESELQSGNDKDEDEDDDENEEDDDISLILFGDDDGSDDTVQRKTPAKGTRGKRQRTKGSSSSTADNDDKARPIKMRRTSKRKASKRIAAQANQT